MVRRQLIHREKIMSLEEARDKLIIDEDNVYYELTTHPRTKAKVSTSYAYAFSESMKAKEDVKILRARISVELQKKEKLSDKKCESMVLSDPRNIAATHDWIDKARLAEEWRSLREDWNDRSNMLSSMSRMVCEGIRGGRQTQSAAKGAKPKVASSIRETINKQRTLRRKDA